jgi:hypothetical protein
MTHEGRDRQSPAVRVEHRHRRQYTVARALSHIDDPITGTPRPVDYRNLDSEELGGMYEGLLAYTPRYDVDARTFTLDIAAGNDRKKSGSYYTPSELIDLVLDEALDPLIDEALRAPDPEREWSVVSANEIVRHASDPLTVDDRAKLERLARDRLRIPVEIHHHQPRTLEPRFVTY